MDEDLVKPEDQDVSLVLGVSWEEEWGNFADMVPILSFKKVVVIFGEVIVVGWELFADIDLLNIRSQILGVVLLLLLLPRLEIADVDIHVLNSLELRISRVG